MAFSDLLVRVIAHFSPKDAQSTSTPPTAAQKLGQILKGKRAGAAVGTKSNKNANSKSKVATNSKTVNSTTTNFIDFTNVDDPLSMPTPTKTPFTPLRPMPLALRRHLARMRASVHHANQVLPKPITTVRKPLPKAIEEPRSSSVHELGTLLIDPLRSDRRNTMFLRVATCLNCRARQQSVVIMEEIEMGLVKFESIPIVSGNSGIETIEQDTDGCIVLHTVGSVLSSVIGSGRKQSTYYDALSRAGSFASGTDTTAATSSLPATPATGSTFEHKRPCMHDLHHTPVMCVQHNHTRPVSSHGTCEISDTPLSKIGAWPSYPRTESMSSGFGRVSIWSGPDCKYQANSRQSSISLTPVRSWWS